MNDRPQPSDLQPSDDVRLHAAATHAFDGHVRSVAAKETEAALAAVRERMSDGHDPVLSLSAASGAASQRRTWLLVAASVSVLALVAGLLVTVLRGDGGDVVVPATDPETCLRSRQRPPRRR